MKKPILAATAAILLTTVAWAQPEHPNLDPFLGESHYTMQELGKGRGMPKITAAASGDMVAYNGKTIRISTDGGKTWGEPFAVTPDLKPDGSGGLLLDETTGHLLILDPMGTLLRSTDNGKTWKSEPTKILANPFQHGSPETVPVSTGAYQAGITLAYGKHPGRLLVPGRIFGPTNSNDNQWRPYHYNTSLYSDDGGKTWQCSSPFPVLGSGEGALAELSDGRVLYSSREHMTKGNRYFGYSYDDGATWLDAFRSPVLPDGVRGSSYGCMGGLMRLPIEGRNILLYSNLDTDQGEMPKEVGGSIVRGREKVTIWVSFDGGQTWPTKRLVFDGPSAYSSLGVGRKGTPSEGKIFLFFEGGPEGINSAQQMAVFNLSWVLAGK